MLVYSFYEDDNRVRRYAETLIDIGYEVDVVALQGNNRPPYYNLKGVHVYGIQKRIKNEKNKLGYFMRIFKFMLVSMLFLSKKQALQKYDLIHIHSVPDFLVFAALFLKITGTKIILDIHDIVPELYITKFKKKQNSTIFKILVFMEKLSACFADHVIIANHIWYERVISRSIHKDKVSVVLNYPDDKIFNVSRNIVSETDFIMLYPGTLSKHQGIDVALRALHKVKETVPNLKFHIYGRGTDESYLKDLTAQFNLTDRVSFFSPVPLEEIAQVMANADFGIEPKLKEGFSNEAFSTKIFEFMLLNVPVIVSDTYIHKYYVDQNCVRYFEAGNAAELSGCIIDFYRNKKMRMQYVAKSKAFIKNLRWSKRKAEYLNILSNVTPLYAKDGTLYAGF